MLISLFSIKEARQQEIDLELEDCQKRMYGVLQVCNSYFF